MRANGFRLCDRLPELEAIAVQVPRAEVSEVYRVREA